MNRWPKIMIVSLLAASLVLGAAGCSAVVSKIWPPHNESRNTAATPPDWLHMVDERHGCGWSDGHPVVVTSDGGIPWTDVTPGVAGNNRTSIAYRAACFVDAQTGWAFALQPEQSVTAYGTRDGGRS